MYSVHILIYTLYFWKTHALHIINKEIPLLDSNCTALKNTFGNFSAAFTLCAINNSRPITMCEKCVDLYFSVQDSYTNMSKQHGNGTSCLDKLVNSDRLQIVLILYENNVNLWTRAKCDECYEIENGTQSHKISNQTQLFQSYYANFKNCTNQAEEINLCSTCMHDYVKLDNYYKSISNVNDKISICMDLVDIMNTTWTFWSTNCCKYRKHNEYIFIGSTVGMLLFTIAFYFIVQFCKEKNAPTIIQQSRFFESLNLFRD